MIQVLNDRQLCAKIAFACIQENVWCRTGTPFDTMLLPLYFTSLARFTASCSDESSTQTELEGRGALSSIWQKQLCRRTGTSFLFATMLLPLYFTSLARFTASSSDESSTQTEQETGGTGGQWVLCTVLPS